MHRSSYQNMARFVSEYLDPEKELTICDIGSQIIQEAMPGSTYRELVTSTQWKYIGCDIVAGHNVDVVLEDIYHWRQIQSNSVDVVISGQAFEHVEFVWVVMAEICRVLKNDGLFCIIAPSSGYRHRYPLDCWRFYEDGMSALARFAGLEVLEAKTQRSIVDYLEYDSCWQDSVLVGKKPPLGVLRSLQRTLNNKRLCRITDGIPEQNRRIPVSVTAQLYFSLKGSFSEEESLTAYLESSQNQYQWTMDISGHASALHSGMLRFDIASEPVEATFEEAYLFLADGEKIPLTIESSNGMQKGNLYRFTHSDPACYFSFDGQAGLFKCVYFSGSLRLISD